MDDDSVSSINLEALGQFMIYANIEFVLGQYGIGIRENALGISALNYLREIAIR